MKKNRYSKDVIATRKLEMLYGRKCFSIKIKIANAKFFMLGGY